MQRRALLAGIPSATGISLAGCLGREQADVELLETSASRLALDLASVTEIAERWALADEHEASGTDEEITIRPEPDEDPIVDVAATRSHERAVRTFVDEATEEELVSGVAVYDSIDDARDEWDDELRDLSASFVAFEADVGTEALGLGSAAPFVLFRQAEAIGFVRHRDPVAAAEAPEDDDPTIDIEEDDEHEGPTGGDADLVIEYASHKHEGWG